METWTTLSINGVWFIITSEHGSNWCSFNAMAIGNCCTLRPIKALVTGPNVSSWVQKPIQYEHGRSGKHFAIPRKSSKSSDLRSLDLHGPVSMVKFTRRQQTDLYGLNNYTREKWKETYITLEQRLRVQNWLFFSSHCVTFLILRLKIQMTEAVRGLSLSDRFRLRKQPHTECRKSQDTFTIPRCEVVPTLKAAILNN